MDMAMLQGVGGACAGAAALVSAANRTKISTWWQSRRELLAERDFFKTLAATEKASREGAERAHQYCKESIDSIELTVRELNTRSGNFDALVAYVRDVRAYVTALESGAKAAGVNISNLPRPQVPTFIGEQC